MSSWIRVEYSVRAETITADSFTRGSVVLREFEDTYGLTGERLQYQGEDIPIPWLRLSPSVFGQTFESSTDTFDYVMTSALLRGSVSKINADSDLYTGYYIDARIADVHDATSFRPPIDDVHQISSAAFNADESRELLSATNLLGGQFSAGRLQINGEPISGLPLTEGRSFSRVPSEIWILFDEEYKGQDDYKGFPEKIKFTSGDDVIDFGEIAGNTGTLLWAAGDWRNSGSGDDAVILPTADEAKLIRNELFSPSLAVQFLRLEVLGHEAFFGGDGDDVIDASNSVTTPWYLYGEKGDDELIGGPTNDAVFFGSGNNTLTGGAGMDLFKGVSQDFDRAESISSSVLGKDTITDFVRDQDKIDLSDWDANPILSGNQNFLLRNGGFSGQRGEISMRSSVPKENGRFDITLEIDTTGSKTANHVVLLEDVPFDALTVEDFIGVDAPDLLEITIRPQTGTFFAFAEEDSNYQFVEVTLSKDVNEVIEILTNTEESELASDLEITVPLRIPAGTKAGEALTFALARAVDDNEWNNFENGIEAGNLSFSLNLDETSDGIPIEIVSGQMIPFQIEDGLMGKVAEDDIEKGRLTWEQFFTELKQAFGQGRTLIELLDPKLARSLFLGPTATVLKVIDAAFDSVRIADTLQLDLGNAKARFEASDGKDAAKILYANDTYDAWRKLSVDAIDTLAQIGFGGAKVALAAGLVIGAAGVLTLGAVPIAVGIAVTTLVLGAAPALSYDATIGGFVRNAAGAAFDFDHPRTAFVQGFIEDPVLDEITSSKEIPLDAEDQPPVIDLPDQSINLRGDADSLDGRIVTNFTDDDLITVQNATFAAKDMTVTLGSAILDIDSDGDGFADTKITLQGDFSSVVFDVATADGDTIIRIVPAPFGATAGSDTLIGTDADETIYGLAGNDRISALSGNDTLLGGLGEDRLDGGPGADRMVGGQNGDFYIVDNVGDVVVEVAGDVGIDRVASAVSFDISEIDVETLILGGSANTNGTGNDKNNYILGSLGNNEIDGGGGNDRIEAAGGDDTLRGGAGNDTLNGGPGSDIIYVDDAGDRVAESRRWEGEDHVIASVDFRMGSAHIETLELVGEARLGAGNGLKNIITGNDGDNLLDGGKNVDTLIGGAGDDIYLLRAPGDNAVELAGGGIDTVRAFRTIELDANVENLHIQTLRNAAGEGVPGVNGFGNALDNEVVGNPFDNVIAGRGGNDTLRGQAGADTFVFDTALGADNADVILDFNLGAGNAGDRLQMDQSVFTGIVKGELAADLFAKGTAATDANDRFVFDGATGQLFFDADGAGGAVQQLIATFANGATVEASDIFLV